MGADSVSLEAQMAMDTIRKSSLAEPVIQSDNGSSFISREFKTVLKENTLTQKLIKQHTPVQNGIVERRGKNMRESLVSIILTDYEQAKSEISGIIQHYNTEKRLIPELTQTIQYNRGNHELLLTKREAKIEKARILRREENLTRRKGSETAGTVM